MSDLRWAQLTGTEREEFLDTGGTGVLSFARGPDEPPRTIPISYGYDADAADFFFRLSFPSGSSKGDVIGNPVSFVAFEDTDEGWKSVVATGTLEDLTDHQYESAAVQGLWAVDIPAVDIFDRPRDEITFLDFRLDPEHVTGRKEIS